MQAASSQTQLPYSWPCECWHPHMCQFLVLFIVTTALSESFYSLGDEISGVGDTHVRHQIAWQVHR